MRGRRGSPKSVPPGSDYRAGGNRSAARERRNGWTKPVQEASADRQESKRRSVAFIWVAIVLAAAAFVGALLVRRRREESAGEPSPWRQPPQPRAVLGLEGLTEEEAEARRQVGQDNAILFNPLHSPREILRTNTLTIFNLSLIGLAFVQVLLRKPLDAVLTIGVLASASASTWAKKRGPEAG